MDDHPECVRCTILIGPGHEVPAGVMVKGKLFCSDCQKKLSYRPTPFREILKSRDGLFEFWKAGASRDDLAIASYVVAGDMKVRMRKRV